MEKLTHHVSLKAMAQVRLKKARQLESLSIHLLTVIACGINTVIYLKML